MKQIEKEITSILTKQGAALIRFVDLTGLPPEQNRNLPNAVFFGLPLTPSYVREVKETPDYVKDLIAQNRIEQDEFHLKELKAGELSDRIADLLISHGYRAYSQSDTHLIATDAWNEKNLETPLPHKTVAVQAGAGWIGKNNLLITPEYGPALCIGTVLTDAPLTTVPSRIAENRCGECRKCAVACPEQALSGTTWEKHIPREDRINVHRCTTCMKCLVHCPYARRYIKRETGEL